MTHRLFYLFRLSLLLVVLPLTKLFASSESYVQSITGHLKKGDSLMVIDDKFLNMPLSEWNRLKHLSVEDIISFELRQDTALSFYTRSFSCTLNVSIKYFTSRDQQSPETIDNIDLVVKYDTAKGAYYPTISRYRFKNAFKVTVVINSISSPEWKDKLPDVFRLRGQIVVERKYPFDKDNNGTLHLGALRPLGLDPAMSGEPWAGALAFGGPVFGGPLPPNPIDNVTLALVGEKMDISWAVSNFTGGEEYDVEWTYIDKESNRGQYIAAMEAAGPVQIPDATIDGWMDADATRVTVSNSPYAINLPYMDGYILVRVRKAGYKDGTNIRGYGQWVRTNDQGYTACVKTTPFNNYVLNWQYSGTFAEEGKKKEVLSYFDGAGKSRQLVTLSNADQWIQGADHNPTAVVQETVYDVMGRPAVSMLPAPVRNSSLDYYPGFNLNNESQPKPYSYSDIVASNSCGIGPVPSSSTSGASQYYSPNNTFLAQQDPQDNYTRYVADAELYPFSATEYTPDNTGRIRRQGGVGKQLAIDGNNATQFLYSKPTSQELERLFGMEVGNSSHYIKNTVIDPNGQASVSYIDANGKTIATALAGDPGPKFDRLASTPTASTHFNETLIKPADFSANSSTLSMTAAASFVTQVDGAYQLHYSVNPLALVTPLGGTGQLCNNCYYSIAVKVTDACGDPVDGGSAVTQPFTLNDYSCSVSPDPIVNTITPTLRKNEEYTMSYSLQLSNDVINAQTDYYIRNNTTLSKLSDFFSTELNNLKGKLGACYNTCDACKSLTDPGIFLIKVKALLSTEDFAGIDPNSQYVADWSNSVYSQLKQACLSLTCVTSPCEEKLALLKQDVLPGGQYALYDADALAAGNTTNLFQDLATNVLPNYTTDPAISGQPYTMPDGSALTVGNLNQAEFIRAYIEHPEWADIFVKHHIEYCSYLWCKDASNTDVSHNNEVSYTFDATLQQMYQDGNDAVTAGYYDHNNVLALLQKDPWFNGVRGSSYLASMQADLQKASDALAMTPSVGGTALAAKDLIQLTDWLLYCKPTNENITSDQVTSSWNNCAPSASCRSVTVEWTTYLNFYLQLKNKYYRIAKLATPQFSNCLDCFIGTDPLATAGCVISGSLSDYSVVETNSGSSYSFNIVYKNGAKPFDGNYTFSYLTRDNFTQEVGSTGQVTAHAGDNYVTVYSVTLPQGQSLGITYHYEVTGVTCTPSALSVCAATPAAPPPPPSPCPAVGEFYIALEHANEYYDPNLDATVDTNSVYLVHKVNGVATPVQSDVTIKNITVQVQFNNGPIQSFTEPDRIFPAGDNIIYIGKNYTTFGPSSQQSSQQYFFDNTNSANVSCPPVQQTAAPPPSMCTSNPNYANFQNKIRIFNDYIDNRAYNSCIASGYAGQTQQQAEDQARQTNIAIALNNLNSTQANWLGLLTSVRNEEFANDPAAPTDNQLTDLASKLQRLSAAYLQAAITQTQLPIVVSSTLPSGVNGPDGYNNFRDIFVAVVGAAMVQKGFGPDLIDNAYPYDKQPVPADLTVNQLVPSIASNVVANLNAFQLRYQNAGSPGSFGSYLAQQLGDDYLMTDAQLADLQARIAAGCQYPYLANPVFLPVAFVVDPSLASHSCSDLSGYVGSFASDYPQVTDPNSKLYHILIVNYLNHKTGWPLSYADYGPVLNGTCTDGTLVYDKPQTPTIQNDYFDCTASLLKQTYLLAGQEYDLYIKQKRIEFRNAYVSKCLSNQPSLNVDGYKMEYHYTLYYYDQSGDLVKTVPPEGVRLLTDQEIAEVESLPAQDPAACALPPAYVLYNTPAILSVLGDNLRNNSSQAMEMWLYSNDGSSVRQLRMISPDNNIMYQVAISDGKIWAELYSLAPDGNGGIGLTLTNQAVGVLSSDLPLMSWTHVVLQSTAGVTNGAVQIYVDGNKLTMLSGVLPPYPFIWGINAGYTLPSQDLTEIKTVRLYHFTLQDDQIASNFKNSCMIPDQTIGDLNVQLWGRFDAPSYCNNNTGRATPVQVPNKGSLVISGLANPTGTVNNWAYPSATDNFTMEFWVKPDAGITDKQPTGTDIYAGIHDAPPYALFPMQGIATGTAGAGVAVGTNGITVFEHAPFYIPAVLDARVNITDWTHVAVVYSNGVPSIYVNGALVASGTTRSQKTVFPSFNFGGTVYGVMRGKLDEVRIWNYARSADQISKAYARTLTTDEQQGLLGYWPMDGTSGASLNDVSCGGISNQPFNTLDETWSSEGAPITETNYIETASRFIVPNHGLPTNYAYNSLDQVVRQSTPDAGTSNFVYDRLGRLVISQNAEQLQPTILSGQTTDVAGRYSYTRYDAQGRTIEVGEKTGGGIATETTGRTDDALNGWYNTGSNRQVTVTAYDVAPTWAPTGMMQNNLRKRVTATALLSSGSDATQNRQAATYYSYDVDGNVSDIYQENAALIANESQLVTGNGLKHIQYQYDLISGKVNKVLYQDGKWDQFYYQYKYDDDNRLVDAYSDRLNDNSLSLWKRDAHYTYYHHGPLARLELGDPGTAYQRVQGLDYAYTLQGWLKGVNGQHLSADGSTDMGGDGVAGSPNVSVPRDVMGYSLGYYSGDYKPIGGSGATAFGNSYSNSGGASTSGQNLFNGNIGSSTYALDAFEALAGGFSGFAGYSYRYDQLNRMTAMDRHNISAYSSASGWDNSSATDDYHEIIHYDGNGNILAYRRNGHPVAVRGNSMDQLTYYYNRDANGNLLNNRLRYIYDTVQQVAPAGDPQDITSQPVDNYTYDALGNLLRDQQANLTAVNWTVYGKMSRIAKSDGSTIAYGYDVGSNRITKSYATTSGTTTSHYVRDAQGQVLAVYQYKLDGSGVVTEGDWLEQHLYGSSRLGVLSPGKVLSGAKLGSDAYVEEEDKTKEAGRRLFELTNHLGNVMVTINDGLNPAGTTPNTHVMSAQDYYPFGMQMPGRTYIAGGSLNYRYGFNGKENDNEVKGAGDQIDYGMRVYDPRVGRFLSVDPLAKKYPELTPYQYASGNPIMNIDIDGLEGFWYFFKHGDWIGAFNSISWNDANEAAGTVNNAIPVGAAINGGYQAITGTDPISGQPASRVDGVANIVITGVFHYSAVRLATPSTAVALERQMAKNAAAAANKSATSAHGGNIDAAESNAATEPSNGQANTAGKTSGNGSMPARTLEVSKGGDQLAALKVKVQNTFKGIDKVHLDAAIGDMAGKPIVKWGQVWDHLDDITGHLRGLNRQIKRLNNLIDSKAFSGDVLKEATDLRSSLQKQYDSYVEALQRAAKKYGKEVPNIKSNN